MFNGRNIGMPSLSHVETYCAFSRLRYGGRKTYGLGAGAGRQWARKGTVHKKRQTLVCCYWR